MPEVRLAGGWTATDWVTIGGLIIAVGVIAAAILIADSNAQFIKLPAVLIVLVGTAAATAISFTGQELARAGAVIGKSVFRRAQPSDDLARALMDLAIVARKKGVLALISYEDELAKEPFLAHAVQLVVDGYPPKDVEAILAQQTQALASRHRRAASIARRAAEVAPAMGLIGTLVGLVQMLADLTNPDAIGPAMAVALLTTFYGAILGTVVMGPLAVKLEKRSSDEVLLQTLVITATLSIARQENPRRLEMLLNAILPPAERIRYFD